MNCSDNNNNNYGLLEAISIGAVKYNLKDESIDKFHSFIKPRNNIILSRFCMELTNITQDQIDRAEDFKTVMVDFGNWIGQEKSIFVSWGPADITVVKNDNKRNGFRLQIVNQMRKNYIDFQKEFSSKYSKSHNVMSLTNALLVFNKEFEGIKHNALDDAYNLFRVYKHYKEVKNNNDSIML